MSTYLAQTTAWMPWFPQEIRELLMVSTDLLCLWGHNTKPTRDCVNFPDGFLGWSRDLCFLTAGEKEKQTQSCCLLCFYCTLPLPPH